MMIEKVFSLRSRLLALIILPLLIIVSIGTVALYYDSQKKSQEIFDKLLHTISQVIIRDVVISEGDLLIFPAYLPHKVGKNESDEDRIVISFNIDIRK